MGIWVVSNPVPSLSFHSSILLLHRNDDALEDRFPPLASSPMSPPYGERIQFTLLVSCRVSPLLAASLLPCCLFSSPPVIVGNIRGPFARMLAAYSVPRTACYSAYSLQLGLSCASLFLHVFSLSFFHLRLGLSLSSVSWRDRSHTDIRILLLSGLLIVYSSLRPFDLSGVLLVHVRLTCCFVRGSLSP